MKTSLQIRKTVYRNQPGFLVMRVGNGMFGERIFVRTIECAKHIKAKLVLGQEIIFSDYQEVA